ncbi:MAG: Glutamate 5-kinase [Anaerolineales bacterium]|nr:Glutamate 5-kinase [Anaerolineales bacterium]
MLVFLKLGGSLITDKTREETPRLGIIRRLAREIRIAHRARPDLRLLLGHGSGSFGHFAAKRSRFLGRTTLDPAAYARVGAAAARLNRIVTDILVEEGVPAVSLPPSASARCSDGRLQHLATASIDTLLAGGAVPLVHGDVALDDVRGATIVSTEDVFVYLAKDVRPARIILAGEVDGVYTADPMQNPEATLIGEITPATFAEVVELLGGSAGVDVTGGMLSKVRTMVDLVAAHPELEVCVISGLEAGRVEEALTAGPDAGGTLIRGLC